MNPKKIAAERAVEMIEDGMVVGLGSGSTAYWAIHKISERVSNGLNIRTVASSNASEDLAKQLGIPIVSISEINYIDLTIDGADEVDNNRNLIKGGGGALLREKILSSHSNRFIVIVDETKLVDRLGRFPLPVEIVPFASNLTINKLMNLNCQPKIRFHNNQIYITDNGNYIVDCKFEEISNPGQLNDQINSIPGVVENGLFVQMSSSIIVGYNNGSIRIL